MKRLWSSAPLTRSLSLYLFSLKCTESKKSNLNAACSFPQTLNSAVPSAHAPTESVESMTEIKVLGFGVSEFWKMFSKKNKLK